MVGSFDPLKLVPDMTCNVFGGTLNLTQQQQLCCVSSLCTSCAVCVRDVVLSAAKVKLKVSPILVGQVLCLRLLHIPPYTCSMPKFD